MQQHLVVWGDIGTDHKALIAIQLDAEKHMVIFRAFPEETVDHDLQHQIFTVWKNGGEFTFPEEVPTWEVDAGLENILPPEIKLHKPHLLVNAQRQWNKKMILDNTFKVLGEKLHILEIEFEGLQEFSHDFWNKTKALWEEISINNKNGDLSWQYADELKLRINSLFDGLKAFKRLNQEKNYDESLALSKVFEKQIKGLIENLIYPDEWNRIFQELKNIQKQMQEAPLIFKHQRNIRNQLNSVFNDLRQYRKSDQISHLDERIHGLKRVLDGLHSSIHRDQGDYELQFEKMKHYTRGKLSDEEIAEQLKHVKQRSSSKNKKIKSIEKTIRSLESKLELLKNPPKPKEVIREKRPKRKKSPGKEQSKKVENEAKRTTPPATSDSKGKVAVEVEAASNAKAEVNEEEIPTVVETAESTETTEAKEVVEKEPGIAKDEALAADKVQKEKEVKEAKPDIQNAGTDQSVPPPDTVPETQESPEIASTANADVDKADSSPQSLPKENSNNIALEPDNETTGEEKASEQVAEASETVSETDESSENKEPGEEISAKNTESDPGEIKQEDDSKSREKPPKGNN